MVDMTAVLDTTGVGTVSAGKKSARRNLPTDAGPGGQAGFIAVLMAQAASDGASRDQVAGLGQLVSGRASAIQDASPGGGQARAMPLPSAFMNSAELPEGAQKAGPHVQSSLGQSASLMARLQAGQMPFPRSDAAEQARSAAAFEAWPAQSGEAPVARVGPQASGAETDKPKLPTPIDLQAGEVGVPGLPQAFVAGAASLMTAESAVVLADTGAPERTVFSRESDHAARLPGFDGPSTGPAPGKAAATSALAGGNVARELPVAAAVLSEASKGVDLPATSIVSETSAVVLPQAGSGNTPNLPDGSGLRPFDHALRQVEARLNLSLEAPVKSPVFAQELGEKMIWLAGRQGQVAEMVLNPPQLGTLEVRLTISGGEAGAQFYSANPVVRETIESALPRLRDMLAQAGINLGEANVRDQSFNQGAHAERFDGQRAALSNPDEAGVPTVPSDLPRIVGRGLVDLYA